MDVLQFHRLLDLFALAATALVVQLCPLELIDRKEEYTKLSEMSSIKVLSSIRQSECQAEPRWYSLTL